MNSARNEMLIKLGTEEIILRPTFENMMMTESNVGGLSYLAWRFSKVAGKGDTVEQRLKNLPNMTELAKIIYYNQASSDPSDQNLKKHSLEKIWSLVLVEGLKPVTDALTEFISIMAAGNKYQEEMTEEEKKS